MSDREFNVDFVGRVEGLDDLIVHGKDNNPINKSDSVAYQVLQSWIGGLKERG